MRTFIFISVISLLLIGIGIATCGAASAEEGVSITLAEAQKLALERNPRLAGAAWAVRSAQGRRIQAGVLPNPELEFEVGEFGGGVQRTGFDGSVSVLKLGQVFELGGKSGARERLAAADGQLAEWDYRSLQLDVLAETGVAFARVASLQERLALDEEKVALAGRVLEVVRQRVDAGKVSPLDATRAGVELSTARIQLEKTRRELDSARKLLAAQWGDSPPRFGRVEFDFYATAPLDDEGGLRARMARNPDLARWDQEIERQRLATRLAKSIAWPDLRLSGGIQRFSETSETAYVVGVSIPLKLFDRNQGGIAEAAAEANRVESYRLAAEIEIASALADQYGTLASAHSAVSLLETELIPAAEKAFAAIEEGYRLGKFGLLEVLDAQRTLFEAREQQIEMLAVYHVANARIVRLTGALSAEAQASLPEFK